MGGARYANRQGCDVAYCHLADRLYSASSLPHTLGYGRDLQQVNEMPKKAV